MDVTLAAWGVLGGGTILALVVAVYTLLVHQRVPSVTSLHAKVTSLETAHTDLVDRVNHWMRRDNTRRLREAQEAPKGNGNEPLPSDVKSRKQALRRKVYRGAS